MAQDLLCLSDKQNVEYTDVLDARRLMTLSRTMVDCSENRPWIECSDAVLAFLTP